MEKYGDIILKIIEIINLSSDLKNTFNAEQLEDGYNKYFAKILGFDISIEYVKEFNRLLEEEKVFYLLKTLDNPRVNNDNLLAICKERGSIANEDTNNYLKLMGILNNANGKNASELIEYYGYFVSKNDLNEFIYLCFTLNVGVYKNKKLKDTDSNIAVEVINNNLDNKKRQKDRLVKVLSSYNLNGSYNLENIINESEKNHEYGLINSKFQEMICLGLVGKLTIDMLVDIAKFVSFKRFEELLNELTIWHIFNKQEIETIKSKVNGIEVVSDVSDLIKFFASKEDLDISCLPLLVPSIGEYNYHELMDGLFKCGVIDLDTYLEYIKTVINEEDKSNNL